MKLGISSMLEKSSSKFNAKHCDEQVVVRGECKACDAYLDHLQPVNQKRGWEGREVGHERMIRNDKCHHPPGITTYVASTVTVPIKGNAILLTKIRTNISCSSAFMSPSPPRIYDVE